MLNIASHTRIYAYTKPADMRKGFNGLSGIIRSEFQSDPTDGSLFLFVNRRPGTDRRVGRG
jgi:transposase